MPLPRLKAASVLLALAIAPIAAAAAPAMPDILPLRERAAVQDRWLVERLDTIVPTLMRANGADMWILIAGEYDEDPVAATMLPATWLSARRRTILLFHGRAIHSVSPSARPRPRPGPHRRARRKNRRADSGPRVSEPPRQSVRQRSRTLPDHRSIRRRLINRGWAAAISPPARG
jgi:hypothetical protein